jgi:hypothetical protein
VRTAERPSNYVRRIYADSIVFTQDALEMRIRVCGTENAPYGSDDPHTIGDDWVPRARGSPGGGDVREEVRGRDAERILRL